MSVETIIDTDNNLVTHTVIKGFGIADIEPAWLAMLSSPDFKSGMNVLWDFRLAAHTDMFSNSDIQEIASMTARHIQLRGTDYKLVLLASRDLYFGFSKMFEAYGNQIPIEIHVFRVMDEALDWLM